MPHQHRFGRKRWRRTNLGSLVEYRESVPCDEDRRLTAPTLPVCRGVLDLTNGILGKSSQFVQAIVGGDRQHYRTLRRVVAQRSRWNVGAAELAHAQKPEVGASVDVVCADILVADVIERVCMHGKSRALPFQLEDNQTVVVT